MVAVAHGVSNLLIQGQRRVNKVIKQLQRDGELVDGAGTGEPAVCPNLIQLVLSRTEGDSLKTAAICIYQMQF
jgi:hypothetical protein